VYCGGGGGVKYRHAKHNNFTRFGLVELFIVVGRLGEKAHIQIYGAYSVN